MTWSAELDGHPGRLPARRRTRMERRYRRLLTLYPKAHRQEHAEEMIGVLFAAADYDARVRAPKPVAWALRSGQHVADCADLVAGAARIRGRMLVNRVKQATRSSWMVRDRRWSDALAVVSVIAPLLLLVAALAEFHLPQAVASSVTGHPHWRLTATLGLGDLPLAAGAPAVAVLALLRLRRLAGLGALAAAIGQALLAPDGAAVQRPAPPFTGYASPVVAFTVLLACTAAAALLLSPGPARGLALLTRGGAALIGAGALILGGFSVGGNVWLDSRERVHQGPRQRGDRPARRPADRRGPGRRGGRLPAGPGQPPGARAAGHPGHPVRDLVAGKAGQRPVRPGRRGLGQHPVLTPPALPAAAAAGGRHRRRDLARPAPRHPAGQVGFPAGPRSAVSA